MVEITVGTKPTNRGLTGNALHVRFTSPSNNSIKVQSFVWLPNLHP